MTEIGTVLEGKYEILKEVGRGGMSVVYLAMDKRLNKQWAVKEIRKKANGENDEIAIHSLVAEANLMKRLDHPTLPRIVDIIDDGKTIYVVMDYIEGESLFSIIKEYGAQPEEQVIEWAKQLCEGLAYLHNQKPPIIYRDMKPSNVMLKPEGNVKIIDFGIAREYKEKSLADTTVLGTRGYAPPEQEGKRQTDQRSDIYALGMTMHHLLTGLDPRNPDYVYQSVRVWNPELSDGIEIIIDKCTQLEPENRYQSCADLMYDLQHPHLITRDYKRKQKKKLNSFLACAVLCIALLIGGFGLKGAAHIINNNNYEELISIVTSTPFEEKVEKYKEAIDIHPDRMEAYFKLLEAYESENKFDKHANNEFLALYNANVKAFDESSLDLAELNYKIGMMYFNYYINDDGSYSFSDRVQKAYPFFEANVVNKRLPKEFEKKKSCECYYQICSFYKKYILNSVNVEEASRDNYMELFGSIEKALNEIEGAGVYDQLTLYNGVFMLLYDQRANMMSVNVPQEEIQALLKDVYQSAKAINTNKPQSKKLRNEIVNNYGTYKESITRTYTNAKEMIEDGGYTDDNI